MSRISELPLASTVNGTDEVEVNQGGVSKRARANTLPAAAVNSVNGETGTVVLDATDIAIAALSPSNYTPDGSSIEEHLSGIDDALATAGGASSITDLSATTHRLFYSDGSGNVVELAFGTSGQVLKSNGASSAPSFQDESGGGGSTLPVTDTTTIVKGSADDTKLWRVEVDGFTASTTRVLTPADRDWSPTVFGEELTEVADASSGRMKLDAAQSSHTHTESDITDLGNYITAAGVTFENLDANGDVGTGSAQVAAGDHTHPASDISDSTAAGRAMLTAADADAQAALLGLQPFDAVQNANTAITIDDAAWGQNILSTATGAVTVTLSNATGEDTYGAITEGDQTITVQVAVDVQYYLEGDDLDGTGRTASFEVRGSITWEVFRLDAGNRRYLIKGGTNHDQDLRGQVVHGNLAGTGTATGTLDGSDSGKILRTTGNITIPQTAGFNVTLIAGGAHTVSFGVTSSPAMASGDVMSVVVDDQLAIHAVLTESADKVSFT